MKQHYPAVIHKDPDSIYGVSFPDFPGCISGNHTPESALVDAAEALALHVAGMVEDGDDLPDPGTLEAAALEHGDAVCVSLVPVMVPGRSKRYNVMLDESVVDRVDRFTGNRSQFLNEAAAEKLSRHGV